MRSVLRRESAYTPTGDGTPLNASQHSVSFADLHSVRDSDRLSLADTAAPDGCDSLHATLVLQNQQRTSSPVDHGAGSSRDVVGAAMAPASKTRFDSAENGASRAARLTRLAQPRKVGSGDVSSKAPSPMSGEKRRAWSAKPCVVDFDGEIARAQVPTLSIVDRSVRGKAAPLQKIYFRPESALALIPPLKHDAAEAALSGLTSGSSHLGEAKRSEYLANHVFRPASALASTGDVSSSALHDRQWSEFKDRNKPFDLRSEESVAQRLVQPRILQGGTLLYPSADSVHETAVNLSLVLSTVAPCSRSVSPQELLPSGHASHPSQPQSPSRSRSHSPLNDAGASRPASATLSAATSATASRSATPAFSAGVSKKFPRYDIFGALIVDGENVERKFRSSGFVEFKGDIKNNVRNGPGTLVLNDGTTLEGTFVDGELSGYAVKTWPDGSRYQGHFDRGEPHGVGEFFGLDGEYYKGEHRCGVRSGTGIFKRYQREIYEGSFEGHRFHGKGKLVIRNVKTIDGTFEKGLASGYCECRYDCGDVFKGTMKGGVEDGDGDFFAAATRVHYRGPFAGGSRARIPNSIVLSRLEARAPEKPPADSSGSASRGKEPLADPYTNVQVYSPIAVRVALALTPHSQGGLHRGTIGGVDATLGGSVIGRGRVGHPSHPSLTTPNNGALTPKSGGSMAMTSVPTPSQAGLLGEALFVPQRRGRRPSISANDGSGGVGNAAASRVGSVAAGGAGKRGTIAAAATSNGSSGSALAGATGAQMQPPRGIPQYEESGRAVECTLLRVPPGMPPALVTSSFVSAGVCPVFGRHVPDEEVAASIAAALEHAGGSGGAGTNSRAGLHTARSQSSAAAGGSPSSPAAAAAASVRRRSSAVAEANSPLSPPQQRGGGSPLSATVHPLDESMLSTLPSSHDLFHPSSFCPSPIYSSSNTVSALITPAVDGVANFVVRPAPSVEPGEYVLLVTADDALVARPGGDVIIAPSITPLVIPIRICAVDRQAARELSASLHARASLGSFMTSASDDATVAGSVS